MKPTAALAYGYWSQNIGNAFFQLGGLELLGRVLGRENVKPIQDVPAHWTLHRKTLGNPERWWNATARVETDYVVFQGPSLDKHSLEALDVTFGALAARGVEPVLLSIGMMQYSEEEARCARELITRHGVRVVATRDSRTNTLLDGLATYDGIDSAFFLPWAMSPVSFRAEPYVALSFERLREPLEMIERSLGGIPPSVAEMSESQHSVFNSLTSRSQAVAYVLHRLRRGSLRSAVGGFDIVRLVHRSNPADMSKFFKDVNTVVADEPYTYAALYAGAHCVFTDRVHAAVVALSFGRRAQMFFDTPRNALLERVGVVMPMLEPVSVDSCVLESERCAELEYLKASLAR